MGLTDSIGTTVVAPERRDAIWGGAVIDCDVHANVPDLESITPYLDEVWVRWAAQREWSGPVGAGLTYRPAAPVSARPEWRPAGEAPASRLALLDEHVLSPWRVDRAILNCYYGIETVRHPDLAAALARAVNDWLIAEWLEKDSRLVASLVIPPRDPVAAAREIDRVGDHPGFVQVLLPVRSDRTLYGQRVHFPMYEAMVRHDLVMGLHFGGFTDTGPSPTGWPSWYVEEYSAEIQVYAAQLISLVAEGVFQKFPTLRASMLEGGFAWVPFWAWNMNKKWKGLRNDVPWVDRLPFDVVRDHVRFSIAPADVGPSAHMAKVIDWLGSDDILMFATDYPHAHENDVEGLLAVMGPEMRENMMSETARRWYGL